MIPKCKCGCKQKVNWNRKKKDWNTFVNHHNSRCFSEETKEILREYGFSKGHVTWNEGLTKETDERVAKYAKSISKHQKANYRKPWNKDLTKKDDVRIAKYAKKVSLTQIGRKATENQLKGLEIGRKWCKGLTKETDERVAKRGKQTSIALTRFFEKYPERHLVYLFQFNRKTDIEKIFEKALSENSIKTKYNYHVGRYWIDFGIPNKKIGFECDGEYWHRDKNRDMERDGILKDIFGWDIFRFTGNQIHNNVEGCMEQVRKIIKQ